MIAALFRRLVGRGYRRRAPAPDRRSGRMVFLIECLLNQNARDRGAATCASATREVLEVLLENDAGMAQIPCPEMACLGFERARPAGTSIRTALEKPEAQQRCQLQARQTADRIEDYLDHGLKVLAILGGNAASPGCAVHHESPARSACELRAESGIFMKALATELEQRDIAVPFSGVRDADAELLEQDLAWLREVTKTNRML